MGPPAGPERLLGAGLRAVTRPASLAPPAARSLTASPSTTVGSASTLDYGMVEDRFRYLTSHRTRQGAA
jgi:hypothetical protein